MSGTDRPGNLGGGETACQSDMGAEIAAALSKQAANLAPASAALLKAVVWPSRPCCAHLILAEACILQALLQQGAVCTHTHTSTARDSKGSQQGWLRPH